MDRGRLLQAVLATVVGAKDNATLGPRYGGVVEGEPSHTENDMVVAEARNVEQDVLCMRSDLKLDWKGFLNDGAGRNRTPINNLKISRLGLGLEADSVELGKLDIEKARRGARVEQSKGSDHGAVRLDGDRQDNVFFVFWTIDR